MNFSVVIGVDGTLNSTYDKATGTAGTFNNIIYSFMEPGTWHFDLTWGIKLKDIKKVTQNNIQLIQQRVVNGTAWMLDAERAARITVTVAENSLDRSRIDIIIDVIGIDGTPMQFVAFVCVGGPSLTFVV